MNGQRHTRELVTEKKPKTTDGTRTQTQPTMYGGAGVVCDRFCFWCCAMSRRHVVGVGAATSQRRLPSRIPMRVFQRGFGRSRPWASKNTGLVKRIERVQSCCHSGCHGALGQSGTTIMMDTRSVSTLFNTCAINGHGWLRGAICVFSRPRRHWLQQRARLAWGRSSARLVADARWRTSPPRV